jgi:16S rRNA (cytosine967-C5)-methyltransferase
MEGGRIESLLHSAFDHHPKLTDRDRAFCSEIVYGVTRWRRGLDIIIGTYSKPPLKKLDPQVLTLLRIGLYQACGMSGVPVSAAVNETVNLAKKDKKARRFAGFINGVMRNALRALGEGIDSIPVAVTTLRGNSWPDLTTQIAETESFPDWLITRWISHFSVEGARQIAAASNLRAPGFLRQNHLRDADFNGALAGSEITLAPLADLTDGFVIQTGVITPTSPLFIDGLVQPQDGSSQIAASLLAPKPGMNVGDICCGKGIKSGGFAAAMNNEGVLVCIDSAAIKLASHRSNMIRLGVTIAHQITADATAPLPVGGLFDAIYVDAPCSATGVIRRHPESKWNREEPLIHDLADRGAQILGRAYAALKPGGRLVYTVCSIEPEEGSMVVDYFLQENVSASRIPADTGRPALTRYIDDKGDLFITPGQEGMDGFYGAILTKKAIE